MDITKRIVKCVLVVDLIIIGILFATYTYSKAMLLGLLLGSVFSVINFRLLAITIEKVVEMDPGRAQIHAGTRYTIRLVITAAVLILALKAPYIDFIGAIIGLFLTKIASLYVGIRSRHSSME
ncbi:ATP synthase I chain [Peptoclostridium litorale DSM 5388]|uniref:ATP synthase subunit I n=2 Tax=Peptoclostridium litorale TaxID=1557 RepID=A0A069RF23_PEPLI|nr:ATP synthase subunit I [Peptoclostridium litorale]KDR94810.1 hypothetical protein CLIT_13c01320 [Peptoclostridium litorale DSM 5388]SIN93184.1 ATP synthase I chain [Peptoclostridium litorale DSM 5388]